jgi:hypothetical protein
MEWTQLPRNSHVENYEPAEGNFPQCDSGEFALVAVIQYPSAVEGCAELSLCNHSFSDVRFPESKSSSRLEK